MKALFVDCKGWRIHSSHGTTCFAWNIRRGWRRSKLLQAETLKKMKSKITKEEHGKIR